MRQLLGYFEFSRNKLVYISVTIRELGTRKEVLLGEYFVRKNIVSNGFTN